MWLIADSGSTTTEWIFFDKGGIKKQLFSDGLNPLFLSKEDFSAKVGEKIQANWKTEVPKLWFYSAGCGTEPSQEDRKSVG